MKNKLRRSIILIIGLMVLLMQPMTVKATSGGMDTKGLAEAFQSAKSLENQDNKSGESEIKQASKRFGIAITVAVFGGIIVVMCIVYKRQKGVRL